MATYLEISALALRQVVSGVCTAMGYRAAENLDEVVGFLTQRFVDQSTRLSRALQATNEQAWKTLEMSLGGGSFWDRCKRLVTTADQKALEQQIQTLLGLTPKEGLPGQDPEFRTVCLRELHAARKAGLLDPSSHQPRELAGAAGEFARFSDPKSILDAEWHTVERLGVSLRQAGHRTLGDFVSLRAHQGPPLLAVAARYFFRRQVEQDEQLARGLQYVQTEQLIRSQEATFRTLEDLIGRFGPQLDEMLGLARQTHEAVLDIRAEQVRQGSQLQGIYDRIEHLLAHMQGAGSTVRPDVRPGDSMSIRSEAERRLAREVIARYRSLPDGERASRPALLNAVGMLGVAAGDTQDACRDFERLTTLVGADPAAQAQAWHNASLAALERRDWPRALQTLAEAFRLDPARFAPFPLDKYQPERILGAGGFGIAYLCRHARLGRPVVIKTLRLDGLALDVAEVFREAQVLTDLDHSSIIRLRDCDYADTDRKRPYLVMDYFESITLADWVDRAGPLAPDAFLPLAVMVAGALQAAHAQLILHRDVKPDNLLVRNDGRNWQVKLIDFGLALRDEVATATQRTPAAHARTPQDGIAGTLDYAAPEQMGKLPGVPVGTWSDVYGFGRTCYFALLGTPTPDDAEKESLPAGWRGLLSQCTARTTERRIRDFADVLGRLRDLESAASSSAPLPSLPDLPGQLVTEEPVPSSPTVAGLAAGLATAVTPTHEPGPAPAPAAVPAGSLWGVPPRYPSGAPSAKESSARSSLGDGGFWLGKQVEPAPEGTVSTPPPPPEGEESPPASGRAGKVVGGLFGGGKAEKEVPAEPPASPEEKAPPGDEGTPGKRRRGGPLPPLFGG